MEKIRYIAKAKEGEDPILPFSEVMKSLYGKYVVAETRTAGGEDSTTYRALGVYVDVTEDETRDYVEIVAPSIDMARIVRKSIEQKIDEFKLIPLVKCR